MHSRAGSPHQETLFGARARALSGAEDEGAATPLAERMRPRSLAEVVGQRHVLADGKALERAIRSDRLPSMIFWGPPGVGKTTLGRVIAHATKARFVMFSAVLGTLAELRALVQGAKEARDYHGKRTVLFVDEIHRFNKAQQDAFLPHVETGTVVLIGATTENPSFAVNAALLSRTKVVRLELLREDEILLLLERALADADRGIGAWGIEADADALGVLARHAAGDGRRALTALETVAEFVRRSESPRIRVESVTDALGRAPLLHDKSGDAHFDTISAFIKSMRGSDADAAVYWLMRLLEAGDDPLVLLRRMMVFASEDVGTADPRALVVAVSADEAFRRMGMPEGTYVLAHAAIYLANAPKSNAVTLAWKRAQEAIERHGALPVPKKLRNAPTALARAEGHGKEYRSAHDYPGGLVPGETYLPDELVSERFYEPKEVGEESRIRARLGARRGEVSALAVAQSAAPPTTASADSSSDKA
jgi:putative ATPase